MPLYVSVIIRVFIFLTFIKSFSQSKNNSILGIEALLTNNIETAQKKNNFNNTKTKEIIQWHIDIFLFGVKDSIVNESINTETTNQIKVLGLIKNAEIYHSNYFQKDSLIFENLKQALQISKKANDTTLIRFSYHKILRHLFRNIELYDIIDIYAEDFKKYFKTIQDEAMYTYFKYTAMMNKNDTDQSEKYKEVLLKFKESPDYLTKGILNQIIGISELVFDLDYETAIKYFDEAIKNYKKVPGYTGNYYLFRTNNNIGYAYNSLGKHRKALEYYQKKPKIDLGNNNLLFESQQHWSIYLVFEKLKQYDSAFYYSQQEKATLKKYNEYETSLKQRDIETKYKTAEKEKLLLQKENELLIEQKKKKKNQNLLIASLIVLFFGSITAFLLQKNTKRKQLLAEQGKKLQTQKVATLMKEQELTSIDAMIEGQEKERQQIANDLHDDLGGLMATVKLHFNALEKKQSPELFSKTNNLLEEAYQKIRTVAHAKNSGVLAKKGLLKAINDMANKVSSANNLQIEVIDHGLENRLENSLELTIFRIIQELITNVIKHANATEASIQITNHEDKLNIIVEDNGKGFDTKHISKSSGMGIHSIDKRIENLEGTVVIDSKINKGTTVIIDIPL